MDMVNRASIILTEAHLGTGIVIVNRVHRDMVFLTDTSWLLCINYTELMNCTMQA